MKDIGRFISQKTELTSLDDDWRANLAQHIRQFILYDVDALYQLLYRLDVDEKTVRALIAENEKDAAEGIAECIVLRCEKTLATRRQYAAYENAKQNSASSNGLQDVD